MIHNLIHPTRQPSHGNGWYNIAHNAGARNADIYLYGIIGGWNVNAQQFLAELQAAGDVDTITVYLNTVGGSFYDGLPIYNTLKQHKAHVTVKVMGYALSMGSVVMLAGDAVEAAENSLIMIHRAQGGVWGDAGEMAKTADILLKHEAAILPEYARRMGKTETEVQALLQAETWYTAAEAKAAGLVDTITGKTTATPPAATMPADSWHYAEQHFNNIPAALLGHIKQATQEVNVMNGNDTQPETVSIRKYNNLLADRDELQADYDALQAKYTAYKTEVAPALAELAELKKVVPDNTHLQGIVTGPACTSGNRYY